MTTTILKFMSLTIYKLVKLGEDCYSFYSSLEEKKLYFVNCGLLSYLSSLQKTTKQFNEYNIIQYHRKERNAFEVLPRNLFEALLLTAFRYMVKTGLFEIPEPKTEMNIREMVRSTIVTIKKSSK